jgi:methionyl-tRNA formyltransferase
VCQSDRPQGRSKKLVPPPVKVRAAELGIPVHQPAKLNDGTFPAWLRHEAPEVCVLVAYGRILKQPILDVPPRGFLNMHPSLLPKYRGPSPVQSAILEGESESGVTIMRLDAGMDSGDIVLQRPHTIEDDDTAGTLTAKLAEAGAEMMVEALSALECGRAAFTPQDDESATYCKMLGKDDAKIDWRAPARDVRNQIRAFVPWPVAWSTLHGETLRIYAAHVVPHPGDEPPGTVVSAGQNGFVVATGEGALAIDRLQAPGKRVMSAAEFLRGRTLSAGERFVES